MLKVCVLFICGSFVLTLSSKSFSAAGAAADAGEEAGPKYEMVLRLTEHRPYHLGEEWIPSMGVMVELREKIEDDEANRRRYVYADPADHPNPGYIWAAKSWYTGAGGIEALTRGVDAKLHVEYITRANHFTRWGAGDAEEYTEIEAEAPLIGLIYAYQPQRVGFQGKVQYKHKDWLTKAYLEWKREIGLANPEASVKGYIEILRALLGENPKYSSTGVDHPSCASFAIRISRALGFFQEFDINTPYHDHRMQAVGRGWRGFRTAAIDTREWHWGLKTITMGGLVVAGTAIVIAGPVAWVLAGSTAAAGATTAVAATATGTSLALGGGGSAAVVAVGGVSGAISGTAAVTAAAAAGAEGARIGVNAKIPGDIINNILYWSQKLPEEDRGDDSTEPHVIRYKVGDDGDVQDMPLPQVEWARVNKRLFKEHEARKRIEYVL